jgi:hypothetical protein
MRIVLGVGEERVDLGALAGHDGTGCFGHQECSTKRRDLTKPAVVFDAMSVRLCRLLTIG